MYFLPPRRMLSYTLLFRRRGQKVSHSPVRLIVFLLVSLLPALAGAPEHFPHNAPASSSSNRTPRQPQDISPTSVPLFVSDFELFAVGAAAPPRRSSSPPQIKKPAVTSETKNAPPPLLEETDPPAEQARQLMDLVSHTLGESLQKAGYKAVRRAWGRRGRPGNRERGADPG